MVYCTEYRDLHHVNILLGQVNLSCLYLLVQVQALKKELVSIRKSRKAASSELRGALQLAAQARLMEKEKNKSPSCAMRISMRINKVVWSMLADGKTFAETEINDMVSKLPFVLDCLSKFAYNFLMLHC